MLDLLLEKHCVSQELSEEDIREQVNLFLIAGHETLGTTISWALFLLGHHPEVQAKIHDEIDRVFGDDFDRPVTEDDFKDLQYLECVLKELSTYTSKYSLISVQHRYYNEINKSDGYPIPKGAACIIFAYSLHRDEDVFPDPEKFDPDRFSPENSVNIPEFAYIPFSAGPRNCIGYKFAEMELRVILSCIMRNFTVKSLDPMDKVKPILNIGIHSNAEIRIRISSRSVPKPA
ncbi:Cytochrome P450 4V2 [Araneus ventricosus]|uniref:Cytochrome P450 4V2 n=1 Tax=Araneus ventricosus TaxID=182803 RepID=A0A4Y2GQ07_ARAVE|nr:Cytochrome P450 4V2 [Araneus ventricosus]